MRYTTQGSTIAGGAACGAVLLVLSLSGGMQPRAEAGTPPPAATSPSAVVVTDAYGAALHDAPATDAPIETVAACGDVFAVMGSMAGWLQIAAQAGMLWVGSARVADAGNPPNFTCGDSPLFFPGDSVVSAAPGGCLSLSNALSNAATLGTCAQTGAAYTVLGGPVAADGQDWVELSNPDAGSGWTPAAAIQPTVPFPHLQSYAASPDPSLSPLLDTVADRGPLLALRLISVCGDFALLYLVPSGPNGPSQPGLIMLMNSYGNWRIVAAGSAFPLGDRQGAPDALFDPSVPCLG